MLSDIRPTRLSDQTNQSSTRLNSSSSIWNQGGPSNIGRSDRAPELLSMLSSNETTWDLDLSMESLNIWTGYVNYEGTLMPVGTISSLRENLSHSLFFSAQHHAFICPNSWVIANYVPDMTMWSFIKIDYIKRNIVVKPFQSKPSQQPLDYHVYPLCKAPPANTRTSCLEHL
jgi:hypothetical protein